MSNTIRILILITLLIGILFFQSCKKDKDESEVAPTQVATNFKISCKINGKQWQTDSVDGRLIIDTLNNFRFFLLDGSIDLQSDTGVWVSLSDTNISTSYINNGLYQEPGGVYPYFPLIDMYMFVGNDTLVDFDQIETKFSIDTIDNVNHILKYATFSSTLLYSPTLDTFKISNGVLRNVSYVIQ